MKSSLFFSCHFLSLPFSGFQTLFQENKSGNALNNLHAWLVIITQSKGRWHPAISSLCTWGLREVIDVRPSRLALEGARHKTRSLRLWGWWNCRSCSIVISSSSQKPQNLSSACKPGHADVLACYHNEMANLSAWLYYIHVSSPMAPSKHYQPHPPAHNPSSPTSPLLPHGLHPKLFQGNCPKSSLVDLFHKKCHQAWWHLLHRRCLQPWWQPSPYPQTQISPCISHHPLSISSSSALLVWRFSIRALKWLFHVGSETQMKLIKACWHLGISWPWLVPAQPAWMLEPSWAHGEGQMEIQEGLAVRKNWFLPIQLWLLNGLLSVTFSTPHSSPTQSRR